MFPEGKEHLWEDTAMVSVSKVEEALLRRAQSRDFAQHIILKPQSLSKEMLQAIASKPRVVIICADKALSAMSDTFEAAHISQAQQVTSR